MADIRDFGRAALAAVGLLLVALVAGCAAGRAPPPSGPVVAQASLSTGLVHRPMPAARLADPGLRAGIEECERSGGPHCREISIPGEPRESFTKGVDRQVVAAAIVGGLKPGLMVADCHFVGPSGLPVIPVSIPPTNVPANLPADQTITLSCPLELDDSVRAGGWQAEIWINGERKISLPFTVKAD